MDSSSSPDCRFYSSHCHLPVETERGSTEQEISVERYSVTMKITGDILESYLQCKYKVHLKLVSQQGIKADYELLLLESRNRVRVEAADSL